MKQIALSLVALALSSAVPATAQDKVNPAATRRPNAEQEILNLSRTKWRWMSERNVDSLAALFHEDAVFVPWADRGARSRSSK
jgi:hypothetical protein